jgi:uncharacterized protein (TIGR03086 family)
MSINSRNYITALFGFDHIMRGVPSAAWDNPSPCSEWSARDVAGHAMGVVSNVAARAGVGTALDVFKDVGAIAGPDPYATWHVIRNCTLDALDRPGALQTTFRSSLGEVVLDDYILQMTVDLVVHSWDVARATGGDERLDPQLVAISYARLQKMDPNMARAPGRYGDIVAASGEVDLQTELLTFAGRTP